MKKNRHTSVDADRGRARFRARAVGEQIARDMIAVRIKPDMRMAVVGAPSYFEKRSRPKSQDLTDHVCINLRLSTMGASMPGNSKGVGES